MPCLYTRPASISHTSSSTPFKARACQLPTCQQSHPPTGMHQLGRLLADLQVVPAIIESVRFGSTRACAMEQKRRWQACMHACWCESAARCAQPPAATAAICHRGARAQPPGPARAGIAPGMAGALMAAWQGHPTSSRGRKVSNTSGQKTAQASLGAADPGGGWRRPDPGCSRRAAIPSRLCRPAGVDRRTGRPLHSKRGPE